MNNSAPDLIEELRLRRWARINHVPFEGRDETWHPVILDEMTQKDIEIQDERYAAAATFAPLVEPLPLFHPPHRPTGPRFLASPQRSGELHYT